MVDVSRPDHFVRALSAPVSVVGHGLNLSNGRDLLTPIARVRLVQTRTSSLTITTCLVSDSKNQSSPFYSLDYDLGNTGQHLDSFFAIYPEFLKESAVNSIASVKHVDTPSYSWPGGLHTDQSVVASGEARPFPSCFVGLFVLTFGHRSSCSDAPYHSGFGLLHGGDKPISGRIRGIYLWTAFERRSRAEGRSVLDRV